MLTKEDLADNAVAQGIIHRPMDVFFGDIPHGCTYCGGPVAIDDESQWLCDCGGTGTLNADGLTVSSEECVWFVTGNGSVFVVDSQVDDGGVTITTATTWRGSHKITVLAVSDGEQYLVEAVTTLRLHGPKVQLFEFSGLGSGKEWLRACCGLASTRLDIEIGNSVAVAS